MKQGAVAVFNILQDQKKRKKEKSTIQTNVSVVVFCEVSVPDDNTPPN